MGIGIAAAQQRQMLDFLVLLMKWNRAYNLTAVRDPAVVVRRQLLDSLSILPFVDTGPVLDIGTGAGLPGIPLAIARPGLAFSLLDTNGKKTRFVQQVVGGLGLANVEVIRGRVEQLDRPGHYARITSRAFATLADMVNGSQSLLAADGCWLAMKGTRPDAEIRKLPPDLDAKIEALEVPGETAARNLIVIVRKSSGAP
jgi:16S rRNA (guanine527-N7)-methyltransferase